MALRLDEQRLGPRELALLGKQAGLCGQTSDVLSFAVKRGVNRRRLVEPAQSAQHPGAPLFDQGQKLLLVHFVRQPLRSLEVGQRGLKFVKGAARLRPREEAAW